MLRQKRSSQYSYPESTKEYPMKRYVFSGWLGPPERLVICPPSPLPLLGTLHQSTLGNKSIHFSGPVWMFYGMWNFFPWHPLNVSKIWYRVATISNFWYTARTENIRVILKAHCWVNNSISASDRPCLRIFGLRKVFKTARLSLIQARLSLDQYQFIHKSHCLEHFPKADRKFSNLVGLRSMLT